MELSELKEVKGEWRLFVNGMQQVNKKDSFTYDEMINFINGENASITNTSCEYIVRCHKITSDCEFRNNHWARENN